MQKLYDYVVNHLRTQGLYSNKGEVRGEGCMCAFGCIADLYAPANEAVLSLFDVGNPCDQEIFKRELGRSVYYYGDPEFISKFLGYKIDNKSPEYRLMLDLELIYEESAISRQDAKFETNYIHTLRRDLDRLLQRRSKNKESLLEELALRNGLKYTKPNTHKEVEQVEEEELIAA